MSDPAPDPLPPRPLPPPVRRVARSPTATDEFQVVRTLSDADRPFSRLRHGSVDPRAATEAIPEVPLRPQPSSGSHTPPATAAIRHRRQRRHQQARRERRIMIASVAGAVAALAALSAVLIHLFATA